MAGFASVFLCLLKPGINLGLDLKRCAVKTIPLTTAADMQLVRGTSLEHVLKNYLPSEQHCLSSQDQIYVRSWATKYAIVCLQHAHAVSVIVSQVLCS